MKICGILVQYPPFSDEQLDSEISRIDTLVKVKPRKLTHLTEVANVLISEGLKIVYIHEYPSEYSIGVKFTKEFIEASKSES